MFFLRLYVVVAGVGEGKGEGSGASGNSTVVTFLQCCYIITDSEGNLALAIFLAFLQRVHIISVLMYAHDLNSNVDRSRNQRNTMTLTTLRSNANMPDELVAYM